LKRLTTAQAIAWARARRTAPARGTGPSPDPSDHLVVEPAAPDADEVQGAATEAQIRVDLSETGEVLAATVVGSTGNLPLDAAARTAALHSTYTAEIVDCKPRAGSNLFRVDFTV
jgi:hypothetical protein